MTGAPQALPNDQKRRAALMAADTVMRYSVAAIAFGTGHVPALVLTILVWTTGELLVNLAPFFSVPRMADYIRRGAGWKVAEDTFALLYLPMATLLAWHGHPITAMLLVVNAWVLWTLQRKRRSYGRVFTEA